MKNKTLEKVFTKDTVIPSIVTVKIDEAYSQIYSSQVKKTGTVFTKATKKAAFELSKAAIIILACFLLAGTTAVAATIILRHERLMSMSESEINTIYEDIQASGNLPFEMSRELTKEESKRYASLEKAYTNSERFPEAALPVIDADESKNIAKVTLIVTEKGSEHILFLPERNLTDEEMLEIIEYLDKESFVLYEHEILKENEEGKWQSRMNSMTDEEVDFVYAAAYSSLLPTDGGFICGKRQYAQLSDFIGNRYNSLLSAYENDSLYPDGTIEVIEWPDEYDGKSIKLCAYDSIFYLPDRELTDEEILELIDFTKKEEYVLTRLEEEIRIGYRTEYPDTLFKDDFIEELEPKVFHETRDSQEIVDINDAKIGYSVYFGSYEQDGIAENGAEKISWMVIDSDENNTVTLMANKVLDTCKYDTAKLAGSWNTSIIRKTLNEDFYKKAFSETEKAMILDTVIEDGVGSKVYILSLSECLAYFGIPANEFTAKRDTLEYEEFCAHCLDNYDTRIYAVPTKYAEKNGAETWSLEQSEAFMSFGNADLTKSVGNTGWWLRDAHLINEMGAIGTTEYADSVYGIRPVIKVKINK